VGGGREATAGDRSVSIDILAVPGFRAGSADSREAPVSCRAAPLYRFSSLSGKLSSV